MSRFSFSALKNVCVTFLQPSLVIGDILHFMLFAFLARLLILIKKVGYYNWSSESLASALALTFACGHDNLKSFSCILPKFVTLVTNDQFSDELKNG